MSAIRDYVMEHALFCHHDHHCSFEHFEANRSSYHYRSLLGYAEADLVTAAGVRAEGPIDRAAIERLWPSVRGTGYGRAVTLCCRELFGLEYGPDTFDAVSEALQGYIGDRPAEDLFDELVHEKAANKWTIQDGRCWAVREPGFGTTWDGDGYLDSYRFVVRMDPLWEIVDPTPIEALSHLTGVSVHSLDDLVEAMNAGITYFQERVPVVGLKIGMAYRRDLHVGHPTRHEAEMALNRILSRGERYDGMQQYSGVVGAAEGRKLADYMLHQYLQRAEADNLPVQIHTGYLAGNWGALEGTKAIQLLPLIETYRRVRFDLFHASWPWTSEMGAIGKEYPNVWLDMCWAWTMNPTQCLRALDEWLDAVPYTKIFAYGADTMLPWCNLGYSLQAKMGVATVLERKMARGDIDLPLAKEIADAILLGNGETFFGVG